jgi:hypothetical protein
LIHDVVDTDGRPAAWPAGDRGGAVGQSGDPVALAGEDVSAMHSSPSQDTKRTTGRDRLSIAFSLSEPHRCP